VHTLSIIDTGFLNLNDNDLIIDYTGASPLLPRIFNYLKSGYNAGDWRGLGIDSKSAHLASLTPHPTSLGYAEASALALGTFDGQLMDGSTIVIRYTWSGDANLDGLVKARDFNALATNFGGTGEFWHQGDFNYDSIVNTLDFTALATNFNQVLPAPALATFVPEPAAVIAMLIGYYCMGRHPDEIRNI
jgi:hypothetical protein